MNSCHTIMYHYIRKISKSFYKHIKGLDVDEFRYQMAWLKQRFNFINLGDIYHFIYHNIPIPERAVLLTFDDGFRDHFEYVFPILDELGIQGVFFISTQPLMENSVLDVHKVHFIQNQFAGRIHVLIDIIRERCRHYRIDFDTLWTINALENRLDTADVVFIKKALQVALPYNVRHEIVHDLFSKYVTEDERAFSNQLYMTPDQITCLVRHGMQIGLHGYSHSWMDNMSTVDQEQEIVMSLEIFKSIGIKPEFWSISYPNGRYDASLMQLLSKYNCMLGFTVEVKETTLSLDDALHLSRFDAVDFPVSGRG